MATAVEPNAAPSTPGRLLSLPVASLIGAFYVLAALAVVLYAVQFLWNEHVTPALGNRPADYVLWIAATVAVLLGLVWFGFRLAGDSPPKGVHGGVFLMVSAAIAIFFVARAVALNFDGPAGMVATAAVAAVLVFLAARFFTGRTAERWMVALESHGWFTTRQYKRSLGVRVRRLTILGILIVGGSGAYSLWAEGLVPDRLTMSMPFDVPTLTLWNGAKVSAKELVPALLLLVTAWVAFRAVNVPDFAEFLIATEAEMNKVSWSTRKRLMQDTVVVLLTTLIMTLFLLVVDLFWGWLLSRQTVGVLPSRSSSPDKGAQVKEAKW